MICFLTGSPSNSAARENWFGSNGYKGVQVRWNIWSLQRINCFTSSTGSYRKAII